MKKLAIASALALAASAPTYALAQGPWTDTREKDKPAAPAPAPTLAATTTITLGPPAPAATTTAATPPPAPPPAPAPAHAAASDTLPAAPPLNSTTPVEKDKPETNDDKMIKQVLLHGFRLGYLHVMNYDQSGNPDCPTCSPKEKYGLRSPHQFLIGYEITGRMTGTGWLNVLLVGNVMVSGLEQSKFYPSANGLIGFERNRSVQMGVGINVTPEKDKPAHMIAAAGWTPRTGNFYVPVHVFFIPDVDKNHRMGATFGVNW
jgi:hypothetical protein